MYMKTPLIGIFASSTNDCIGCNNRLPWYIPQDLAFFRQQTNGQIIIMGRKTFESLPNSRLPNRIHIVVTNNPPLYNPKAAPNIYLCTFNQLDDLLDHVRQLYPEKKVFVIGGASMFRQLAEHIHVFLVTHIQKHVDGDVFFHIDEEKYPHVTVLDQQYDSHENCVVKWVCYANSDDVSATLNIL